MATPLLQKYSKMLPVLTKTDYGFNNYDEWEYVDEYK